MMQTLWDSFGWFGLVWVLATAVCVLLLLGYVFVPFLRGANVARGCLVLGVIAVVVGGYRTERVDEIELFTPDVSEVKELDPAKAAELKARASKVRFAEDSKTDALDIAGASRSELETPKGADEPKYAFQKRGKQTRDGGQAVTRPASEAGEDAATQPAKGPALKLAEPNYSMVRRYDHMALSLSTALLWCGVLLLLADFVLRSGRMFAAVVPLGVAARVARAILPSKNGHVWVKRGGLDGHPLGVLAAIRSVQKDGTCLYVGPSEPWSGKSLARVVIPSTASRMPSLVYSGQAKTYTVEFVLESLWHGRACVSTVGRERGALLLGRLVEMVTNKELVSYPGRRMIQVVWDLPEAPDQALLEGLLSCAQKAEIKVLVVSDGGVPSGVKFGEVYEGMPGWDLSATAGERVLMWVDEKVFARGV